MLRLVAGLPFTISMLILLVVLAVITHTHQADLDRDLLNNVGFAPWHLQTGEWFRLFTSALVTSGGATLYVSLVMFALCVGAAEKVYGTALAATSFWAIHIVTLLTGSLLIAYPLHWLELPTGSFLVHAGDVGPSAGYYGCLGLVIVALRPRYREWSLVLVAIVLVMRVTRSYLNIDEQEIALTADIAHLIALMYGAIVGYWRPML